MCVGGNPGGTWSPDREGQVLPLGHPLWEALYKCFCSSARKTLLSGSEWVSFRPTCLARGSGLRHLSLPFPPRSSCRAGRITVFHFVDKNMEAQRDEVTGFRSPSQEMAELGFEPRHVLRRMCSGAVSSSLASLGEGGRLPLAALPQPSQAGRGSGCTCWPPRPGPSLSLPGHPVEGSPQGSDSRARRRGCLGTWTVALGWRGSLQHPTYFRGR